VEKGKYLEIDIITEEEFPFVIEDPIDPTFNPGYMVTNVAFSAIVHEFKKAYLAVALKGHRILEVPYKGI